MDRLGALTVAAAVLAVGLLLRPGPASITFAGWLRGQLRRERSLLERARVPANPRLILVVRFAGPILGFLVGWLASPVFAALCAAGGSFFPRLYLAALVRLQARRSERQAPQLLQALVTSFSSGSTYIDAIRRAQAAVEDPWLREDIDWVLQRFFLNVPLANALREVRGRIAGRNLGLVWDTLAICAENNLPTRVAHTLLSELTSTVHFNVQMQNEVLARVSGQRMQVWLLAILVPGLYLYLRLLSPELLSTLDDTAMGKLVLLPAAAALEVLGLYLSVRISRVTA